MKKKVALSIAGSDPSGGAGIQADLKSFSYIGVYGLTAITCVTVQNTQTVKKIEKIPVKIVESQIDTLYDDFTIDAVKTGMLYSSDLVRCVAKKVKKYDINPIMDPIMVATSNDSLSQKDLQQAFIKHLLPHTYIITANIPEAVILSNRKIFSLDDMKKACKIIAEYGPRYVLIKGGHLSNDSAIDLLYDNTQFLQFSLPKIQGKKAHGSGCSLSALVTGFLALGEAVPDAIQKAKYIVWSMIQNGYSPGKGSDVLNHACVYTLPPSLQNTHHIEMWLALKKALQKVTAILPRELIPEVGMNFGYAIKNATHAEDVCALTGRIIKTSISVKVCGTLDFGGSKHIASIILAAMSYDKTIRSALNIRFSEKTIDLCTKAGMKIGFFDRKNEPLSALSTMEWGTREAISQFGNIPDIIFDKGGRGKEPMIRLLGENPQIIFQKLQKILQKAKITEDSTKSL